jgi:hypothetical protein
MALKRAATAPVVIDDMEEQWVSPVGRLCAVRHSCTECLRDGEVQNV